MDGSEFKPGPFRCRTTRLLKSKSDTCLDTPVLCVEGKPNLSENKSGKTRGDGVWF